MSSELDDVNVAQVKSVRRQILKVLHATGLMGCNEKMILSALTEMGFLELPNSTRRHLDYLEQIGLIKIADRDKAIWAATLSAKGTDVMEGVEKAPPGIAKI
jgi:hypothetical protein